MTKVLIVLTGAKEWRLKDGSKHFGGVWSPEFVYPHDRFTKAGYDVVVATLGGLQATVDPASLSLGLQENDQAAVDFSVITSGIPRLKLCWHDQPALRNSTPQIST